MTCFSATSDQPSTMQLTTATESVYTDFRSSVSSLLSINENTTFLDAALSTSATTKSQTGTKSVVAHSLPASTWISISLGIIIVLMIVAISTLFYLKRKLLFKSLTKHKQTDKSPEVNIYSCADETTTTSKTKSEKLSSGVRHPDSSLQTGTEMTVNVLYSSFDPVTNGNTAQDIHDNNDFIVENNSSKMTENILYDGYETQATSKQPSN